jgi:uncharacterized protein (TIGR00255 family)
MPVYSMTGYASAASHGPETSAAAASITSDAGAESSSVLAETPVGKPAAEAAAARVGGPAVNVELRSVNGRFLDLTFRLPDEYRSVEPALRDAVSASIRRGKVELRLSVHGTADGALPSPKGEQLSRLARLESTVQTWLPNARGLSVDEVLGWCKSGSPAVRMDEAILEATQRAVQGLVKARAREGAKLVTVLMERVTRLRELADAAEPLVPEIVKRQQQRFLDRWKEALEATGAAQTVTQEALQERALNEAAAYSIRIDVAEELARLRSHLDEVARLLKAGGEVGKRLDFLMQELQREANTLGSKSAALEMTNISVEMKVAIEQLREQVQNLE